MCFKEKNIATADLNPKEKTLVSEEVQEVLDHWEQIMELYYESGIISIFVEVSWLKQLRPLGIREGVLYISYGNASIDFVRRYKTLLEAAIRDVLNKSYEVEFVNTEKERIVRDIIKTAFTSEEMKSYLCDNWESLDLWQIADMIKYSDIAPIKRMRFSRDLRKNLGREKYKEIFDKCCRMDLNVPVPFKPGDIIACNGGKKCGEVWAVVLHVGDNRDCCSLVAACIRQDGKLDVVPVKHSFMFYEQYDVSFIPPLFSARRISRESCVDKEALVRISDFVNGSEDRGYIVERNTWAEVFAKEVTEEWVEKLELDYEEWFNRTKKI